MRQPLPAEEIARRCQSIPQWRIQQGRLHREFRFRDFKEAFGFMTSAALSAEAMDHHPDWSNVYNRVRVELWTHDAGGLTDRDFELAAVMDRLAHGRAEEGSA